MSSLAARRKAKNLKLDLKCSLPEVSGDLKCNLPEVIKLSSRMYMYVTSNGKRLVVVQKHLENWSQAVDMSIHFFQYLCRTQGEKSARWPWGVLKQNYGEQEVLLLPPNHTLVVSRRRYISMTQSELIACFYNRRNQILVSVASKSSGQSTQLMCYKLKEEDLKGDHFLFWQALDISPNVVPYWTTPPKLSSVALVIAKNMVDYVSHEWATRMCSACNKEWHLHTCTNLSLLIAHFPFVLDYCIKNILQVCDVCKDISNQLYGDNKSSYNLFKSVSQILKELNMEQMCVPIHLGNQHALNAIIRWSLECNLSPCIKIVECWV